MTAFTAVAAPFGPTPAASESDSDYTGPGGPLRVRLDYTADSASAYQTCAILCAISSNIVQYWQYVQYLRTRAICTICTISLSILYTKLHAILSNMMSNILYNFDQYALLYCVQYREIYCAILQIKLHTILLNIFQYCTLNCSQYCSHIVQYISILYILHILHEFLDIVHIANSVQYCSILHIKLHRSGFQMEGRKYAKCRVFGGVPRRPSELSTTCHGSDTFESERPADPDVSSG